MNCGHDKVPNNVTLCPIKFASKCLLSAELQYSKSEWEALGILQCLEKSHHGCFAKELCVISDNTIGSNDQLRCGIAVLAVTANYVVQSLI